MKEIIAIIFSIVSLFIKPVEPSIKGMILPHHDLAREIFHNNLKKLQDIQSPSTIVIYGTNHYFPEGPTFTTSNKIQNELNMNDVLVDDKRIEKEHSIQTLIPYLKEYFPEANIIPIIISSQYDTDKLNSISEYLVKKLPKDTLFVASVDFSHNSTVLGGLSKNEESIDAIRNFNYQKILDYHDDHMDSPVTITLLMKTMEIVNAKNWETWSSSHGGLITNTPNLNGTSYVVGVFK